MILPKWPEVAKKFNAKKKLTPLEKFIYDNEPCGLAETRRFRKDLAELVDWLVHEEAQR